MENAYVSNNGYKEGIKRGIPIVMGYLPVALAFGILSKTVGISMFQSFLFSLFVFAGASQFMALNLIAIGAGIGEIVLATLLVNFRHFIMSASLVTKISKDLKKYFPIIAFCNTDEVFSVLSFEKNELTKGFILGIQFSAYSSWVLGTLAGYILGGIMPEILSMSMGISLYALFIAILVPEVRKSYKVGILALLSGGINSLLNFINILPGGWNIIIAILVSSTIGMIIFDKEGGSGNE
ncbi:AzlC family ABC transporter permease [Clostridium sediminicola]|uniref:AzlC family ABC transporter permease n=1 Tax=Clostridium sediminicola TaxID=3114879 RepID=UPI0031F26514